MTPWSDEQIRKAARDQRWWLATHTLDYAATATLIFIILVISLIGC